MSEIVDAASEVAKGLMAGMLERTGRELANLLRGREDEEELTGLVERPPSDPVGAVDLIQGLSRVAEIDPAVKDLLLRALETNGVDAGASSGINVGSIAAEASTKVGRATVDQRVNIGQRGDGGPKA